MGLSLHLDWDVVCLHRPDQPHPPFDLAIVQHDAGGRDLHGGATRALVDQQPRAWVIEMVERLGQRDWPVALALSDGQQPGFRPGAGMDMEGDRKSVVWGKSVSVRVDLG